MRYLRVYEWARLTGRQYPGVIPMVVVNLWYDDNREEIERAVEEFSRRRQGERVLMPFWLLSKYIREKMPGRPDLDWLTIFENGIEVQPTIDWLRPLGERLRERGMWVDLIAADVEDGVTTWHILGAWDPDEWERRMSRIYDSPRAYARLPQDLKRLRPRDFNMWTTEGRDAMVRFNHYAQSLLVEAFRKIFIESRIFDDPRGRKRFRLCNWWDLRPTFPVQDMNTWPVPGLATDSVSSWSVYLTEAGWMYANRQHEVIWNVFIHNLNIARSCAAAPGGSLLPWISSPRFFARTQGNLHVEGYDEKNVWLWREMIAHLVRTGVREFLFWNSDTDLERSRRLVAETMRANDRPFSRRRLDEIPFDVDHVTTRGYTTRYSDFLSTFK